MKLNYLKLAVVAAFVLVLVWLLASMRPAAADPYAQGRADLSYAATATATTQRLADEQATAPARNVAASLWLVGLPLLLLLAVSSVGWLLADFYRQRRVPLVRADARGLYPVSRHALARGHYDGLVGASAAGYHTAAIEGARRAMVPQVPTNYAPHITVTRSASTVTAPVEQAGPALAAAVPVTDLMTIDDALAELRRDNLDLCFGSDPTGKPVIANLTQAVHILATGNSGAGKSRLAQGLITQLLALNSPDRLQLACLDIEGISSRPFRPYAGIYADSQPDQIVAGLEQMVAEMERRKLAISSDVLEVDPTKEGWPYWIIFNEEALALLSYLADPAMKELRARYYTAKNKLALQSRKWGLFLLDCKQSDYANAAMRSAQGQFSTRLAGFLKPSTAQALGFTDMELIKQQWQQRVRGRFLAETEAGATLIDAPRLEPRNLPALLASYRPVTADRSPAVTARVNSDMTPDDLQASGVIEATATLVSERSTVHLDQPATGQYGTSKLSQQEQAAAVALARAGISRRKIALQLHGGMGRYDAIKACLDAEGL